jgi:hypothetical protein
MRRPLAVAGVILAGLCLAEPLLWLWGEHALASGFGRWADRLREQGWTVEVGRRSGGGFPFAATLVLTNARISGGERALPGGVAWRGYRVVLSVSLMSPFTLSVAPEEQQFVRVANVPSLIFHADRMEALVPLLGGQTQAAVLTAEGVTAGIVGSHHPQDVRLDDLSVRLEMRTGEAGGMDATLRVHADQIGLPDIGRWPLGALIGAVGGTVDVHSPALPGSGPAAIEAAAWQRNGGRLDLHDARLKWGPLSLSGEAELGLDAKLQPAGKGVADVTGGAAAFDALVNGGVLQKGLGATAKAVLGAMAQLPGGDAVQLPFVLRDSTLSIGPIPVARLNDVVW